MSQHQRLDRIDLCVELLVIRVGTPAATTRGFGREECSTLADWISDVLDDPEDEHVLNRVRGEVEDLCRKFPVYPV